MKEIKVLNEDTLEQAIKSQTGVDNAEIVYKGDIEKALD
jgi:hypothetical protein